MIDETTDSPATTTGTLGDRVPRGGNWFTSGIARLFMWLVGWRVHFKEMPNAPKMLLIGAPHSSNFDFFLALGTIYQEKVRVSWMGKHTLFRGPMNKVMRSIGGVPVDRTKRTNLVQQIIDAYNERDEFIISIMPEGTRSYIPKWRSGFYHIATGANVPMVPVKFDYATKVLTVGPAFDLTGDIEKDLPMIQAHFDGATPRHPERKLPPAEA